MKKVNTRTKAFEKKLNDFLHTIGDKLYDLRMNRKATLKTVSRAVKISPGRLSKIEKGPCPHCKFGTLAVLWKYYRIKLTDIATKGKLKTWKAMDITRKRNRRKSQTKIFNKNSKAWSHTFNKLSERHEAKTNYWTFPFMRIEPQKNEAKITAATREPKGSA